MGLQGATYVYRKVPHFNITGQTHEQKARACFEIPPWKQVLPR